MALYKIERLLCTGRGKKLHVGTTAGPASYATGGFAYDTGLNSIDAVIVLADSGYMAAYDTANSKIKAYYFDYNATADGAAIEVAATTNLSGVTFTVIAVGE